jgi:hypothetical protein
MTYRDDILALDARERAVTAELAIVDAELAAHTVRQAEASHLRAKLEALRIRRRQASVEHLALHPLRVAKPCRVPWSSMQGGEHVRHCGQCNKVPAETPGEVFKPAPPDPIVEEPVEATELPPPGDDAVPSYGPYTYEITGYVF